MSDYVNPWLSLATTPPEPYQPRRSRHPTKLHVGDKVGRWTLVEYLGPRTLNGRGRWRCQCACGSVGIVQANNLNAGNSLSCGCSKLESPTAYGRNKPELARAA